jgi:hypothetical protein
MKFLNEMKEIIPFETIEKILVPSKKVWVNLL